MDAKKKKFLIEYEKESWHISKACENTGISRGTFYHWVNNDKEFAEAYNEVKEKDLDDTELQLKKLEQEGNVTAIIFKLKTQGKSRGYVERQELTGADGDKFQTGIVILPEVNE